MAEVTRIGRDEAPLRRDETPRPRDRRPRPLLRTVLGDVLRRHRQAQRRTLADVARDARVSMPYLSEVERGRKEASSEVLAAVCDALGIELSDVLTEVGRGFARDRAVLTWREQILPGRDPRRELSDPTREPVTPLPLRTEPEAATRRGLEAARPAPVFTRPAASRRRGASTTARASGDVLLLAA